LRLKFSIILWSAFALARCGHTQAVPAVSDVQTEAQQPIATNRQAGPYSLQLNSQLVVLDVVVTDKKGAPVMGLTRDDFHIYENKVPQQIVSFEPASNAGSPGAGIHSTVDLDHLAPQAPVSILVLDEITTSFEDEAFAQYAMQKYLATEGDVLAEPTMLMAVTLDHQTLLHDYTTSKQEILDALKKHFSASDWRRTNSNMQSQQVMAALLSLSGVAGAMMGHEGHKNIIWVGRGFPDLQWNKLPPTTETQLKQAIVTCTNRLRDARATLYSVDPAGLGPGHPMTHADPDWFDTGTGTFQIQSPDGGQEDFDALARATGGRALHGKTGVDQAIAESVSYGQKFYTIAYKPTSATKEAAEVRAIQIVMTDRTLIATGPQGYFSGRRTSDPALDAQGKVPRQVEFDLAVASDGMMVYDGVPLTIERIAGKPDDFRVSFSANALAWTPDGSQDKGDITLLVSSYDDKGKLLHREGRLIGLVRPPLPAGQADSRMVHVLTTMATSPPATRVRVLVRANGSGRIGTSNYILSDRHMPGSSSTRLDVSK
jgi:VWFA-related protein